MVLQDRIINLPVKAGNYSDLALGDSGEIFYIVRPSVPSESSKLHKYSLKDRKDEEIMELGQLYNFCRQEENALYERQMFLG